MKLNDFARNFGTEDSVNKFFDQKNLLFIQKDAFLINDLLKKQIANKEDLVFAGIPLGREQHKAWHPSIAMLDIVNEFTERKTVVNEKAAWMFSTGKNVLRDSILKKYKNDGLVFVENEEGDLLGFGELSRDGVRNILDRGDFLRREQN